MHVTSNGTGHRAALPGNSASSGYVSGHRPRRQLPADIRGSAAGVGAGAWHL